MMKLLLAIISRFDLILFNPLNNYFCSNNFLFLKLRKLLDNLVEDQMSDIQFAEGIKIIEYFQHTDLKSESLIFPTDVVKKNFDLDLIQIFWNELEEWLKLYQDLSEKHKALYNHAKKIRDNFVKVSEGAASEIKHGKRPDSVDILKKDSNIGSYLNRLELNT